MDQSMNLFNWLLTPLMCLASTTSWGNEFHNAIRLYGEGKKKNLPFVCLNLLYNNLILVLWVILNNIYYSFSLGHSWFCGLCHNHIPLCSLFSTTGVAVSLDKSPSYFCSSQWPGEGFFMPHLAPYITILMMRRKAMVSNLCRMMQLSRPSSCAAAWWK